MHRHQHGVDALTAYSQKLPEAIKMQVASCEFLTRNRFQLRLKEHQVAEPKSSRKQPKNARKLSTRRKAELLDEIVAQELTTEALASKYRISMQSVKAYKGVVKRAENAPIEHPDWPDDPFEQIKLAFSRICWLAAHCRVCDVGDLSIALAKLSEPLMKFEDRAIANAAQFKTTKIDFSKFSLEELKTLARVEMLAAGEQIEEPPLCYDPDNPVIYSDTEPDCVAKPLQN